MRFGIPVYIEWQNRQTQAVMKVGSSIKQRIYCMDSICVCMIVFMCFHMRHVSFKQSCEQLQISTTSSKICWSGPCHHEVSGKQITLLLGFQYSRAATADQRQFHKWPHSDSKSLKMDYNTGKTRLYASPTRIWHPNWGSPHLMRAGQASRGNS